MTPLQAEQSGVRAGGFRAVGKARLRGLCGSLAALVAAVFCLVGAGVATAQTAEQLPSRELEKIDVTERLGEQVPTDLVFTNADGEQVQLEDYFEDGKPVVINLMYFGCPMLCQLSTQGLVDVLGRLEWTAGDEFNVLTVSFDPSEDHEFAARYREASIAALGREEARDGWAFLTGEQESITALTESVGFGYEWLEDKGEFAHAAALIVVTPDGTVSRYLHGIQYDPTTLRRSLVEASNGQVGSITDQVLWRCLAYDPDSGEYILAAWTVLRIGGVLTFLALAAALGSLWFLEFRRRKKTAAHP